MLGSRCRSQCAPPRLLNVQEAGFTVVFARIYLAIVSHFHLLVRSSRVWTPEVRKVRAGVRHGGLNSGCRGRRGVSPCLGITMCQGQTDRRLWQRRRFPTRVVFNGSSPIMKNKANTENGSRSGVFASCLNYPRLFLPPCVAFTFICHFYLPQVASLRVSYVKHN